jgi:hypothetical protein
VEVELVSRGRGALVAAVVGSVLLGGCSAQPGAAGVIDGRTISTDTVEQTVREVEPVLNGAEPANVLGSLLLAPYYIEAAEENGVGISTEETRGMLDEAAASLGVPATDWSRSSIDLVRFFLAAQNLQTLDPAITAAVQEELAAADIEVNPRYGTFDEETGQIVPLDLPWIVDGTSTDEGAPLQEAPTEE